MACEQFNKSRAMSGGAAFPHYIGSPGSERWLPTRAAADAAFSQRYDQLNWSEPSTCLVQYDNGNYVRSIASPNATAATTPARQYNVGKIALVVGAVGAAAYLLLKRK
jgi:hypothetical protein